MSSALADRVELASLFAAMLPPVPPPAAVIDLPAVDIFAEGRAAGRADAEAELAPLRTALAAARAGFDAAATIDPAALRGVFATLVTALAEAVVMAELTLAPAVIARLVDAALAAVMGDAAVIVRAHPDDAALLDDVRADPGLPRGTVVVEGPTFVVRDGLRERLAAITEELA